MKKILSVLLMILVVGFCFADEIESEENTTTVDLSVLESQNQLLQLFSENQLNQDSLNAITAVNDALAKENEAKGICTGIIGTEETVGLYECGIVKSMGTRSDELSISSQLYRILREFDESDAKVIYSESFEQGIIGSAIMNRLLKAAGHKVIKV